MKLENVITKSLTLALNLILVITIIILPGFMLPVTQDWFEISKQVLLIFVSVIGLSIWGLIQVLRGELTFFKSKLYIPLTFFLITLFVSLLSSQHKVQPLVNLSTWSMVGAVIFFFLVVNSILSTRYVTLALAGQLLVTTIFSLQDLTKQLINLGIIKMSLPGWFSITPAGSAINLNAMQIIAIMLGMGIAFSKVRNSAKTGAIVATMICSVALITLNPLTTDLPPATSGWAESVKIAAEVVKNRPLAGIGPGNYLEAYLKYRSPDINETDRWNLNIASSSNFLLHILTELGVLGLLAIISVVAVALYILLTGFTQKLELPTTKYITTYPITPTLMGGIGSALVVLTFPLTTTSLFLFLVMICLYERSTFLILKASDQRNKLLILGSAPNNKRIKINLAAMFVFILTLSVLAVTIGGLGRVYGAEYLLNNSFKSAQANNGQQTYELQQKAMTMNPYNPRIRIAYAMTNLAIANTIATNNQGKEMSVENQNLIATLINQALREGRNATALDPENALYWETLGNMYRDLVALAPDAANWSNQAYQEGINRNQVSPSLRLNLGGIYFRGGDYQTAITKFNEAIQLKPDYANGYYNISWAYRALGDFSKAITTMEQVVRLSQEQANEQNTIQSQHELAELMTLSQQAATQKKTDVLGTQQQAQGETTVTPK